MSVETQGKMARGALWMILFKWVERGLGLVSTLILVRLLSPTDFGVVSMAMSFILMAELLSAFSFDVALIQNQSATPAHFNSAWTGNVALGGSITLLMIALAYPISRFYQQPQVFPVICALSLGPFFAGLENIGVVAFRKDLDFRKEFAFQVSRKVLAFCVTIPLAFGLRSYWALVAGTLTAKLGGTLVSYWAHQFRPRLSLRELPTLLRFSRWLMLHNFVNFLKERSTDFIIGRLQGAAALGIYNVNYEFSSIPSNELGMPINRAMLPGFAKMAGDTVGIRRAFSNATGMIAMLAIPAGLGIFAVAPFLVPVLLGQKWLAGVPIMEVLSLNSAILVFHGTIVTVLIAVGHPKSAARTNGIFVAILLSSLVFLVHKFGALGAAYAVFSACIISTPIYLWQLKVHAAVPYISFIRAIFRPLLAALAMIGAVRWALPDYSLDIPDGRARLILFGCVGLGAVVYPLVLSLLWLAAGRPAGPEAQVLSRLQARIAPMLTRN